MARRLVVLLFVFCCAPAPAATGSVEHYLQSARQAGKTANLLIHESSPYLLQHAYNPVRWYPWGEAAFAAARAQNKPIFLSIGYSTCHWCHVMARESFENEAIAAILNEHFISIKVDREERPDIDKVYMQASEIINGYGGWPLTAFLNHQLQPFHVGTYYPPGPVDHHRGLKQLLLDVQQLWTQQRQQVDRRASALSDQIGRMLDVAGTEETLSRDIDEQAMQQLISEFDTEYGGFGAAPKFPQPGLYLYLSGIAQRDKTHAQKAGDMLHTTLQQMAMGGIYDHVGGGFHRYSVDAAWRVPHFEKMLYSQALLSLAYIKGYELSQYPLYRQVVQQTLAFVMSDMRSKQGGFYSALDADSERADKKGEMTEGAYYLWHQQEVKKLLTKNEWQLVRDYYSLEQGGNIDSDPNNEFGDKNILYVNEDYRHATLTPEQERRLKSARTKLLAARQQRPGPHLDDKIIVAWNGMMITAFVRGCTVFERPHYCQMAQEAARFIRQNLVDAETGEVLRRYRNGSAGVAGMLDDYVWLVRASLELYAASDDSDWLKLAQTIAAKQQQLFYDAGRGGYFASTDEDTSVLFRAREIHDGATVAANAVAVENLVDLAKYSGDKNWLKPARKTVHAFASSINTTPAVSAMMLYTSFKFRHD